MRCIRLSQERVCGWTKVWFLSTQKCLFTQRYRAIISTMECSHNSYSQRCVSAVCKSRDTEMSSDPAPVLWQIVIHKVYILYRSGCPSITTSNVLLTSDLKPTDKGCFKQSAAQCGVEGMRAEGVVTAFRAHLY